MLPPLSGPRLSPLELVLIAFEGDQFEGDILPALGELVDKEMVRIVDLAFVSKLADGSVSILEAQELSAELAAAIQTLNGEVTGLLSEGDLLDIADDIDPGMTAASILVEHLWLDRFATALRQANGQLLLAERIPHDVAANARKALIEAGQAVRALEGE